MKSQDEKFNYNKGRSLAPEDILKALLDALKNYETSGEKFYDSADLKRLLNISDSTLYRLRKTNSIPFIHFGKKYFYPKSFFDKKAEG